MTVKCLAPGYHQEIQPWLESRAFDLLWHPYNCPLHLKYSYDCSCSLPDLLWLIFFLLILGRGRGGIISLKVSVCPWVDGVLKSK